MLLLTGDSLSSESAILKQSSLAQLSRCGRYESRLPLPLFSKECLCPRAPIAFENKFGTVWIAQHTECR